MVRYMIDSTDCRNFVPIVSVPGVGREIVSLYAGYQGGSYQKSSHACGNVNVEIDVDGTHPWADVLDIEVGDATPNSAPAWVIAHNKQSAYPAILYCNRSTIHAIANYLAAAGLQVNKDYKWWIATLDGTQTVPDMTGVVAVQVWSANFFPGLNIDLSIIYDDSWKADSMPTAQDIATAILNSPVDMVFPPDDPRAGQKVTFTVAQWLTFANYYAGKAATEIANLPTANAVSATEIIDELAKRLAPPANPA